MKKAVLFLVFSCPFLILSQTIFPTGSVTQVVQNRGGIICDTVLAIPARDTTEVYPNVRNFGTIQANKTDSTFEFHDGIKFQKMLTQQDAELIYFEKPVGTDDQFLDGNGTPSNFPVVKRQETYSGTTSVSGTYTVTFGISYSVAPNIQATCTNCNDTQRTRITSITTTGFTVQGRNEALGLLFSNANGLDVDVLVTEK